MIPDLPASEEWPGATSLRVEEFLEAHLLRISDEEWAEFERGELRSRAKDAGPLRLTGSKVFDEFELETWRELEEAGELRGG